jgi:hypothetical protein
MQSKRLALVSALCLVSGASAAPAQTPASSTQAATLLAQSANALNGSTAVNDVTLTGTVQWLAGSDDETGTAVYKGLSGSYRVDMTFRNGTRSEVTSPVNGVPAGNWIGFDGASHPIALHNLMVDAGWFPTFTLGNLLSSPNSILTYVGQENRNGAATIHLSAYQQSPNISTDVASRTQHFTQVDIYLAPSTFLPVSYIYYSHPDNNAQIDIPTEIRYSSYQTVNGVQVPLHVQKYLNNTLVFDLQFQNTSLNSGVTVTQITAQ